MKLTADAPPLRYGDVMEHPLIKGLVVMVISEEWGTGYFGSTNGRRQTALVIAGPAGYGRSAGGRPGEVMTDMSWVSNSAPAILIERGPG